MNLKDVRKKSSPVEFTALANLKLSQTPEGWRVEEDEVAVEVLLPDFRVRITRGTVGWTVGTGIDPERAFEVKNEADSTLRAYPMSAATVTGCTEEQYGALGGWRLVLAWEGCDSRVVLFAGIDYLAHDVILELRPLEGRDAIQHCRWPGGFVPEGVAHTVMPFMQGVLIPCDWPDKIEPYTACADPEFAFCNSNLYMPWWGVENHDGSAAMLIVETAADAGYRLRHPAGGPTRLETGWESSLGRLRFPRRIRISSFTSGNYVDMAKRYRRYRIERGEFVSLEQKIARTPSVAKLIGSGVLHFGIYYHFEPSSGLYNHENPAANDVLVPSVEWAAKLREFHRRVPQAYVHVDGWGFRGYDNLEPDLLPPGALGGGWEGLRELGECCRELGYPWALHQQYRDHYADAASFSEEHLVHDAAQEVHYRSIWPGGREGWACQKFALDYVRRNNMLLRAGGIVPDGAYLDVFSIVPPDECCHPEHPVSREESMRLRRECFRFIRSCWGIVSSEEPSDWALDELDIVHHGPWPLRPNPGKGPAIGIPIPLFNLVYHDAVVVPWLAETERGGWGCPDGDITWLYALANGAIPYFNFSDSPEKQQEKLLISALHRRVGCREMLSHEFLTPDYRRSRTLFADGTEVIIDQRDGSWSVNPPLE